MNIQIPDFKKINTFLIGSPISSRLDKEGQFSKSRPPEFWFEGHNRMFERIIWIKNGGLIRYANFGSI